MDPAERVRSASRRLAEPMESLAQTIARRATELVVDALDVNAVLNRVDVNELLDHVDVNRVLDRVDANRLLDRVDVERLMTRVDVNALLDRTELRAMVAKSSTTVFTEGIDLVRSQAVGLDDFMARWVNRILRRKYATPAGPPRLVSLQAEP